MRRLVSVFASKRDKHSSNSSPDPPSKRVNFTTSPAPPTPGLTDPAISSASSSSGSASLYLQTPEEDNHHVTIVTPQHQHQHQHQQHPQKPLQQPSKKSWKSWLKSATVKHPTKHKPVPDWRAPVPPQIDDSDEQDDSDSDPYDDDEGDEPSTTPIALSPSPTRAFTSFRNLVQNSLVPSNPGPTPFAQRSDAHYIFPRSLNPSTCLSPKNSLRATTLKNNLQTRCDLAAARGLTSTEQLSITSLASRLIAPTPPVSLPSSVFDEPALSKTTVVSLTSRGLRRWISRPCFEDRYTVFFPEGDGVARKHVTGGTLAVAALEYSEAIDAMVDFDAEEPVVLSPPTPALVIEIPSPVIEPPATVLSPSSPQTPSPTHTRGSPYIAVPSPLRNQHNPPTIHPTMALSQSAPPAVPTVSPPVPIEPPVKRGVRFQEDDKDDVIPLGYALRMKKRREEKAKFLRAENERRALEEERSRIEEERRRRDAERAEWEAERRAWEREKMAMEEERKQRKYAEEVVAARARRESQRAGGVPSLNSASGGSGGGFFPTSPSSTSLHNSERNRPPALRESRRHSRPVYDTTLPTPLAPPPIPRREMSEPSLPAITHANTSLPRSSPYSTSSPSPGSSRPPSIGGGPSTPSPVASGSGTRPPSVYSSQEVSSSEDVRQHRASMAAASLLSGKKRHSITPSLSQHRTHDNRTTSYPVWSGSNPSLVMVPPMPTMMPAFVMMDMPLLPPTPPFMMHQYPRQQSQGSLAPSNSNSSSRGRLSSSVNSSRERVNTQQHNQHPPRSASFPHRPEYRHATSSPGSVKGQGAVPGPSSHRSTHERRGSEDSRRASMPVPPSSSHHHPRPRQYSDRPPQPSSMSRGSSLQQLPQLPSPWTGLPTETGKLPAAISASKQSSKNMRNNGGDGRRQTTTFS